MPRRAPWLCLLLAACGSENAPPARSPEIARVRIEGTRVELAPPPGFAPSPEVQGLALADGSAKIGVFELPTPLSETLPDPGSWDDGELRLVRWEPATIAGLEARLFHLSRSAGGQLQRSWMAVCGDERESLLIVAECSSARAGELETPLRACLLDARWTRSAEGGPTLELQPGADLALVLDDGDTRVYAPAGAGSPLPVGAPFLIVARAPRPVAEGLEASCRERLDGALATIGARVAEVESSAELELAGRAGWELVARVEDPRIEGGALAWLALAPLGDGALVLQGHCRLRDREPYLTAFRAAARSAVTR